MAIVDAFRSDTLKAYITGLQPDIVVPLNDESVVLSNPQKMTGATNTQITLSGTGRDVEGFKDIYVGQVVTTYDRLDLGVLFKGIRPLFEVGVTGKDNTLYGWLDELSELHGVKLYPEDVADANMAETGISEVVVKALSSSLNYTGSFTIAIYVPPIDIGTLLQDLDIYTNSLVASDFIYGTVDGTDLVFPCNAERLTTNVDFTKYKDQLTAIANAGDLRNTANQNNLCKIIMSEFAIECPVFNNTSILVSTTVTDTATRLYLKVAGKRDYLVFSYIP